jgi:hypothetical protein
MAILECQLARGGSRVAQTFVSQKVCGLSGRRTAEFEKREHCATTSKHYERHVLAKQSALSLAFPRFGCDNSDDGAILNVARVVSVGPVQLGPFVATDH